jgi:two-component system sensor histidine kinase DevS
MGDEESPEGQNGGLDMIAARALHESGSSHVLILVPDGASGLFRVAGAAGGTAPEWVGRLSPFDSGEIDAVLSTGQAAVIERASSALGGGLVPDDGRLLVIDLSARGTHYGLLVLVREHAAGTFSKTEVEMGSVFGSHVAVALELARAHRMREQLAVFTDRDRIARDLHDLVIQRLFAAGLSIQSLRRLITSDAAARTLHNVTAELDETIRELRNTIYSLNDSAAEKQLLSSRVLQAVRTAAQSLRFVPRLTLTGPIDAIRDDETASNILAVVTEGLSNAVRHSGADSIRVSVAVDEGFVCVTVQDDGTGFSVPPPGNGLSNLQHRANKLGGTFDVSSSPETGTSLRWTAPVF